MTAEVTERLAQTIVRGQRVRATYNAAEQQFSVLLQQRLQRLLEGKDNCLEVLRRYPDDPHRLGVMVTPRCVAREQLRLAVVERLVWDTIAFVRPDATGGPVAQAVDPDGDVIERQLFSTRYPHIVLERVDRYHGDDPQPTDTTYALRRVQNQRSQTQFNRLLDAANLAFEILRVIPR